MALTIDDITYVYEEGTAMAVNALDHITVEIPDGQFIGLVGHTGSGKSTFVQMLNGLLRPTTGHIYWDGEDIHGDDFDRRALRAKVGLVFQYPEHQLFETDVVTDVMFGPKNLGLSPEECRSCAEEALLAVGLAEDTWTMSPFDLSGGQKRRAAIAGVLAMHPQVLILDEPTAGLDPKGRDEILDMVRGMKENRHMTIVLVSHSMDDVAAYADRILVMNAGTILMDGTPKEVFSRYRELEPIGLSAPQMVYIMQYLKEKGLEVSTDVLTVEDGVREILRALGRDSAQSSSDERKEEAGRGAGAEGGKGGGTARPDTAADASADVPGCGGTAGDETAAEGEAAGSGDGPDGGAGKETDPSGKEPHV